jgi:2-keto-4-pentenoate hydratase/2-oxohepta-3-ene-1,7-dioic acid hydratase in catechol pathway
VAVGKFVATGLNSLSGPNERRVLPKDSRKSDLEVELGIVVGSPGNIVGRTARDTGFGRRRYSAI